MKAGTILTVLSWVLQHSGVVLAFGFAVYRMVDWSAWLDWVLSPVTVLKQNLWMAYETLMYGKMPQMNNFMSLAAIPRQVDPAQRLIYMIASAIVLAHVVRSSFSLAKVIVAAGVWLVRKAQTAKVVEKLGEFTAERMVPGSSFMDDIPVPAFQAELYIARPGAPYSLSGQAWLEKTGKLFTAAHALQGAEKVMLKTKTGTLEMDPERFGELASDCSTALMSEVERSTLGLRGAKLSPHYMQASTGLIASIHANGKTSMGLLTTSPIIGFVDFKGSTIKGFSGAPYYQNNTVYGMHLGAIKGNIGYESAYLSALLRSKQQEDSDAFFEQQIAAGMDYEVIREAEGGLVKMAGMYHRVDQDLANKLQTQKYKFDWKQAEKFVDWAHEVDEELGRLEQECAPASEVVASDLPLAPRSALEFDDSENLIRAPAVLVGARGQADQPRVAVASPSTNVHYQAESLSPKNSEKLSTDGRVPTLVVQNEALTSIPRSTKRVPRRRTRLAKLRNELQLLQQQLATLTGKQTLEQPST